MANSGDLEENSAYQPSPRRVLELYAGIGGMHFALDEYFRTACLTKEEVIIKPVDINPSAKLVYDANFPNSSMEQLDIRALKNRDFEDLWLLTLSPPCQPFSRNGKVLDVEDNRCESFLYILEVLERLTNPPQHIVMENVKGFETSEACKKLTGVLEKHGYNLTEYLLSPMEVGIPNSRLRYYVTATRPYVTDTKPYVTDTEPDVTATNPYVTATKPYVTATKPYVTATKPYVTATKPYVTDTKPYVTDTKPYVTATKPYVTATKPYVTATGPSLFFSGETAVSSEEFLVRVKEATPFSGSSKNLEEFLSLKKTNNFEHFESLLFLPLSILSKYLMVLDVKFSNSLTTNCFTSGYGRFFKGTGSVFCPLTEAEFGVLVKNYLAETNKKEAEAILSSMKLRFFSPAEVAILMGFPKNFVIPSGMKDRRAWRLLGNSLNVHVVTLLFKELFCPALKDLPQLQR